MKNRLFFALVLAAWRELGTLILFYLKIKETDVLKKRKSLLKTNRFKQAMK